MERIKCYSAGEVTAVISENRDLLLVHFSSPLHSSCEFVTRELALIAPKFKSQVQFAVVEPLRDLDLIQAYAIEHIPTLILFRGDTEVERVDRVMLPEELAEFLEAAVSFYASGQPG